MTAPTIRQLLADVIFHVPDLGIDLWEGEVVADALLASPLADMLDMAQWWVVDNPVKATFANPEVVALLHSWSRAERPTTMTPMTRVWKKQGRRYVFGVYRHPESPRWHWSTNWGGHYKKDGSISKGLGFQWRLGSRVFEVVVWPRRMAS